MRHRGMLAGCTALANAKLSPGEERLKLSKDLSPVGLVAIVVIVVVADEDIIDALPQIIG